MKYIVIEIQTNADGTVGNLVTAYDTRNEGESAFHRILSAAAVSELPTHAAVMLTSEGYPVAYESYTHGEVAG